MNRIVRWIVNHFILGRITAPIISINDKLKGRRSQIIMILLGIVYLLELLGVLDKKTGEAIEFILSGMLGPTLVDKMKNATNLKNDLLDKIEDSKTHPSP